MTTTINVFGTTFAKHRDPRFRPGTCANCGEQRRLESFNTHVAISLVFVPTVYTLFEEGWSGLWKKRPHQEPAV